MIQKSDDDHSDDCYTYFKTNSHSDSPANLQEFYFFHVQNVAEMLAEDPQPRPALQRRGPYVFRKYYEYMDVKWENNDEKLSYFDCQWW